ncbi:platelet-activating factor acetylhydrolase isoform II [Actinoplanes lutulentus]|uniref:Platelet-activating factor acetylhydrolase isoform II n=1 Tax=Actinoplanes lutulentus TaxID=1287878 RepID=A0A327Z4A4_9ACTN|nr:acetylhydrolase [Actinoplanes lutulentus]RAK30409.1 platelet-activating factor acetylhydrolase isoform II [Actinoplanes lutulentus]
MSLTRRSLLAAGLAVPVAVTAGGGVPVTAAAARLTLPAPTGPHPVGTVSLHLAGRDTMATLWYPAAPGAGCYPRAPWLPAAPLRALLTDNGFDPGAAAGPLTASREGAPARPGRYPVILFSHGTGGHRSETAVVAQELVSHGYVVAAIDHPHDCYVEFPDGRVAVPDDEPTTPWTHAEDILFLLGRLEKIRAGSLPAGLAAALDLRNLGVYGFSKGATAAALVMNADSRVRAGLSFDGQMESGPRPEALDRPFMLMSADFTRAAAPPVEEFWQLLRGWRLNVHAKGSRHVAYCDYETVIPQLLTRMGADEKEAEGWIGTLDPDRAMRIQQAYPLAFFDRHLRGARSRLLDGPSRAFREVRFIP